RWLSAEKSGYISHPYPVTPYHSDYLQHLDLIESAKKQYEPPSSHSAPLAFKVLAKGRLAQTLAGSSARGSEKDWVATIEEIDDDKLLSLSRMSNAWLGPPWIKEGWFSSYLLLAETRRDQTERRVAKAGCRRKDGSRVESRGWLWRRSRPDNMGRDWRSGATSPSVQFRMDRQSRHDDTGASSGRGGSSGDGA